MVLRRHEESPALHESIPIERDDALTEEVTMPRFRWVLEDEKTGQEQIAFAGLSRKRAEEIAEIIKLKGDHDVKVGRLPPRKAPVLTPPARKARP